MLTELNRINPIATTLILIWTLFWHGLALWRAVKYEQRYWFLALLVFQTFGILEITYLFFFCKKKIGLQDLNPKNFFSRK